jgi:hypothetical protein
MTNKIATKNDLSYIQDRPLNFDSIVAWIRLVGFAASNGTYTDIFNCKIILDAL